MQQNPKDGVWDKNINVSVDSYKAQNYGKELERYKFVRDKIDNILSQGIKLDFLDIGCADAAYIFYLKERYPHINYYGVEFNAELIAIARQEPFLNDVHLISGDARTFAYNKQFDVVLMSGVMSIFDEFEPAIDNMLTHLKPGGTGLIFGGFCTKDIDVLVRFRNNYKNSSIWESGLNMFSLKTVRKYLSRFCAPVDVFRFEIDIDLPEGHDPTRSYTLAMVENRRLIVTGANIIREFYVIRFRKRAM